MSELKDNNLVRFININKKKDGLFANFKAKGVRAGTVFNTSLSIDLGTVDVDPTDSLEKIIEESAKIAVQQLKEANFQFEGLASL